MASYNDIKNARQQGLYNQTINNNVVNYQPINVLSNQERQKQVDNWWGKINQALFEAQNYISSGLLHGFEGLLDFGTNIAAGVGNMFGADTSGLQEFSKRDLTNEFMNSDFVKNVTYYQNGGWLEDLTGVNINGLSKDYMLNYDQYEDVLPDVAQNVLEGVGYSLSMAAMGGVGGNVANALSTTGKAGKIGSFIGRNAGMFASAMGSSSTDALNDGANIGQALGYGAVSGAVEVATEELVGRFLKRMTGAGGKLGGILDQKFTSGKLGKTISKALSKTPSLTIGKELVTNMIEEGLEEVASGLVDPLSKMIYKDGSYKDLFEENGGVQGLWDSFVVGALSAGISSGAQTAGGIVTHGVKGYAAQLRLGDVIEANQKMQDLQDEGKYYKTDSNGNIVANEILTTDSNGNNITMTEYELSDEAKKLVDQKQEAINNLNDWVIDYADTLADLKAKGELKGSKETFFNQYEQIMDYDVKDALKGKLTLIGENIGSKINIDSRNQGNFYDAENNTININEKALASTEKVLDVISHEVGHIGDDVNLKSEFVEKLSGDIDSKYKRSNKTIRERYTDLYKDAMESSNQVKEDTKKFLDQGMTRENAIKKAQEIYIREEIACDNLRQYFRNLDSFVKFTSKLNPSRARTLLERIKGLFNDRNKPYNYSKALQLLRDRIKTDSASKTGGEIKNSYTSLEDSMNRPEMFKQPKKETIKVDNNGEKAEVTKTNSIEDVALVDESQRVVIDDLKNGNYKEKDGYKKLMSYYQGNFRLSHPNLSELQYKKEFKKLESIFDEIVKIAVVSKENGLDLGRTDYNFSALQPNSDYVTSFDIDTICNKRENFNKVYELILEKDAEFFDDADNFLYVLDVLESKGLTGMCRECFVESTRKNLSKMAEKFAISLTTPESQSAYKNFSESRKNYIQRAKTIINDLLLNNKVEGNRVLEILAMSDETLAERKEKRAALRSLLMSEEGLRLFKIQNNDLYDIYNASYGTAKPKLSQRAVSYQAGELTQMLVDKKGKLKKGIIDQINSAGGLRLQSYSDFKLVKAVDVLQFLFEAQTLGLKAQLYTKVLSLPRILNGSNVKINQSIFMMNKNEVGVDRNDTKAFKEAKKTIEWKPDNISGINYREAVENQNNDKSGNTGLICVIGNNDMAAYVFSNDDIRYAIPLHRSGWSMDQLRSYVGHATYTDHTKDQNLVDKSTKRKSNKHIDFESWWDFEMRSNETQKDHERRNIKKYIDLCEKEGVYPKFARIYLMNGFMEKYGEKYNLESFKYKGYEVPYGYYKVLPDYSVYNSNGETSPHDSVDLSGVDFDNVAEIIGSSEEVKKETLAQFRGDKRKEMADKSLNEMAKEKEKLINETVEDSLKHELKFKVEDLAENKQKIFDGETRVREYGKIRDIKVGDYIGLEYVGSDNTKRIYDKYVPTITTHKDALAVMDKDVGLRYLSPREYWDFQGFSREDYQKAVDAGVSATDLYKQAGNSMAVPMMESVFNALHEQGFLNKDNIKVAEVFAGVGASSMALTNLGFNYTYADVVEWDNAAVKSFNAIHNTNFEPTDVRDYAKNVKKKDIDLYVHGSPCKNFSIENTRGSKEVARGSITQSSMMYPSMDAIQKTKPKIVVWENVANVLTNFKDNYNDYINFMQGLGYKSTTEVLNARNYGVPQHRRRMIVVSTLSQDDFTFDKGNKNLTPTLEEYIANIDHKSNSEKKFKLEEENGKKVYKKEATEEEIKTIQGQIDEKVNRLRDLTKQFTASKLAERKKATIEKNYREFKTITNEIEQLKYQYSNKEIKDYLLNKIDNFKDTVQENLVNDGKVNYKALDREINISHNAVIKQMQDNLIKEQENALKEAEKVAKIEAEKKAKEERSQENKKANAEKVSQQQNVKKVIVKTNTIRKVKSALDYRTRGLTHYDQVSANNIVKLTKEIVNNYSETHDNKLTVIFQNEGVEVNTQAILDVLNKNANIDDIMAIIYPAVQIKVKNRWYGLQEYAKTHDLLDVERLVYGEIREIVDNVIHTELKINDLATKINSIYMKYNQKIDKLLDANQSLKNKVQELNSNIETLEKEKAKATKLYTREKGHSGVINVNQNLKKELDKLTEKLDRKISDDTALIGKVYENVSNLEFDAATQQVLDFVLDSKFDENTMFKDLLDENSINEIKTEITDILEKVSSGATLTEKSKLQIRIEELKERIGNAKKSSEIKLTTAREKALQKKLKNRELGKALDVTLVKSYLDLYSLNQDQLKNGEFKQPLNDFLNAYNQNENDFELAEFIIDDIEYLSSVENPSANDIKLYRQVLNGLGKYLEKLHIDRDITIHGVTKKFDKVKRDAIENQQNLPKSKMTMIDNTLSPFAIVDKLDGYQENGILSQLYTDIYDGVDAADQIEKEWFDKFEKFEKEHKDFNKYLNETITVEGVTKSRDALMYDYLVSKDEKGHESMLIDGVRDNNGYHHFEDEKALQKYIDALEKEFSSDAAKEYAKIVREIFDDNASKKEKVDEQIYGYSNIRKDPNHIHLVYDGTKRGTQIDTGFKNQALASSVDVGTNRSRKTGHGYIANVGIRQVMQKVITQQSLYLGTGVAMDNLNSVWNSKIEQGVSLGSATKERMSLGKNQDNVKKSVDRVDNFILNLCDNVVGKNGSVLEIDSAANSILNSLRAGYASYVLGANPKVALMQPASIPLAWKYLSAKNTTKALVSKVEDFPELPPYAKRRIEKNGYVLAQSNASQLKGIKGKISKIATILNTWFDTFSTKLIWKASCLQAGITGKNASQEQIKNATDLFNKAMRETQPNFDPIGRSNLQNSKSQFLKFMTQFKSQVFQNYSNIVNEIRKRRFKQKQGTWTDADAKQFKGVMAGFAVQQGIVLILTALVAHILDKDEDDEIMSMEYWFENFMNKVVIGTVPFLNEIQYDKDDTTGLIPKFKFNENDMSSIGGISEMISSLGNLTSDSMPSEAKVKGVANAIGQLTGIPTNNLYRWLTSVPRNLENEAMIEFDAAYNNKKFNSTSKVNEAIKNNSPKKAKVYYKMYVGNTMQISDSTFNEMFRIYSLGYTDFNIKKIPDTIKVDGLEKEIDQEKFRTDYSRLSSQLDKLTSSARYNSLSDYQKTKAMAMLNNAYYDIAKKNQTNGTYTNLEVLLNRGVNLSKEIIHLVKIGELESTKLKTKKQLAQEYVNRLPMTKQQKYLLWYLAGYKLSDDQVKMVKTYLRTKGLTSKDLKQLFD